MKQKFQCRNCGRCCYFDHPFSLYEWEKDFLAQEAQRWGITLDIRPEFGVLRGNHMLVFLYDWHIPRRCPFLSSTNTCTIHARKPLMCAIYPLPVLWETAAAVEQGNELPKFDWRCKEEISRGAPRHSSKGVSLNWKKLPPMFGITARLLNYLAPYFFLFVKHQYAGESLNPREPMKADRLTIILQDDINREKIIQEVLEVKPIFRELTFRNRIPPQISELILKANFDDLTGFSKILDQLEREYASSPLLPTDVDWIFQTWNEGTAAENIRVEELMKISKKDLYIIPGKF